MGERQTGRLGDGGNILVADRSLTAPFKRRILPTSNGREGPTAGD